MKKNQIEIIDCFTQLMVYTLEFKQNSHEEVYTIDKLVQDYDTLIKQAQHNFSQNNNIEFTSALFPLIAWIDEVILASDYKDKKMWRKNLLQKKLFNTSNAGNEFYDRLNNLSADEFDLRLLYLYCMFLGFKGKYYRDEDQEDLSSVFDTQKDFIHDEFPDHFPKVAFKDAYAQNPLPKKKRFSTSYKGLWILMGVSIVAGLVLFLTFEAHLDGLLERYNIF